MLMEPFVVSAPGKVILFGEHAVVYGKTAIAGSLDLRAYALVSPRSDSGITLQLPDVDVNFSIDPRQLPRVNMTGTDPVAVGHPVDLNTELQTILIEHTQLPAHPQQSAVVAFLYLYLLAATQTDQWPGVTFCTRSTLPIGAGLGSSASYCVCVAAAIRHLFGLEQAPSSTSNERDTTVLERINAWAFLAEKVVHGNPSGVDNTVSTFGGALSFASGQMKAIDAFQSLRFIITDTKVPRNTKILVAGVRQRYQQIPAVITPILEAIQGVSETFKTIVSKGITTTLSNDIGQLMDINHHLLAALGVSHSALEDVRRITCDFGLVTKLTGAGGGGCALTLIPDDISAVTLAKVKSSLEQHGYQCYETNVGGGGVAFAHFTEASQMLPNHPAGFLTVPANVLDNGVNWLYYSPSTATSSTSTTS